MAEETGTAEVVTGMVTQAGMAMGRVSHSRSVSPSGDGVILTGMATTPMDMVTMPIRPRPHTGMPRARYTMAAWFPTTAPTRTRRTFRVRIAIDFGAAARGQTCGGTPNVSSRAFG